MKKKFFIVIWSSLYPFIFLGILVMYLKIISPKKYIMSGIKASNNIKIKD